MAGYNIVGGESNLNKKAAKNSQFPSVSLNGMEWNGFDLTAIRLFLTLGQRDDQPEFIAQTGVGPS